MKNDILSILLIEDNEADEFIIKRQLKKSDLNFNIKTVSDKHELLSLLESEDVPDLILSDYFLPDFTGLEALQAARYIDEYIPFIIITGTINEETAVKCIKAGADDYLTKDNLTRLPSSIKNAIQNKENIKDKLRIEKDKLRLAEEHRNLIKTVNTPIVNINGLGFITDMNKSARELFRIKKSDLKQNLSIYDMIDETVRDIWKNVIEKTLNGKPLKNYELTINSGKNTKKVLFTTSLHSSISGKTEGIVLIGQDITDMVSYREDLRSQINKRTEELRVALEKEKELVNLKFKFVSMASHELRTPLAAIEFVTGFLKKYHGRIENDIFLNKLDKIDQQTIYMRSLLDDILIIGKSNENKDFHPVLVNISDFFSEVTDDVLKSTNKSHQIKMNNPDKGAKFQIDIKRGKNIFINLLSNAIKFSPQKQYILFENSVQNDCLVSKITDFGIGIPEDEIEHIFEPFHRAKNTDQIFGTGLGLHIVKQAVEIHGGTINVESDISKGTKFVVTIPLRQKNK